ncbi:glycosyltransferase family 2 protein [Clostridium polynesiense]|uniref:glycosyltransferase family 2 protein n=1 Tax=Clostridium polynesiense TaxID=1325933 RepID=UPI00058F8616|nr:glycosyltransferase [Clostridium polynesiense]
MNDLPLISIIIPAYNHENYILDCLNSILLQKYKNIQLIVLNDGSKDNTAKLICEFKDLNQQHFNEFIFIDKANEGVVATINKGYHLSKGKYISIIASDDMMIEGRLLTQIEFMEKNNSFISCGNSLIIRNDIKTNEAVITKELKKKYEEDSQFYNLIVNYFISTPTIVMRREVIEEIGLYDNKFFIEDWPYYVKVAKKYKIDFIDKPFCYYRLHGENTTSNKSKMFNEEKQILRCFFNTYHVPFKIKRQALSQLYIRNKGRKTNKLIQKLEIVKSQLIYLDIEKIKNKLKINDV